jgi:aspartyl-tRNA(Asn)/glutamyl-tRNA(Gln) amidotransferase subunit C
VGYVAQSAGGSASIEREFVERLARLARIALTEEELHQLTNDLDAIITAVARVGEVATDDVPPMTHAVSLLNVTRRDVVIDCLQVEDVLGAAPAVERNMFRVPRIVAEGP